MAREAGLGDRVVEIIEQHHGTSLLYCFLDKAKPMIQDRKASEEMFRYPGPRPRTREAAIVMLADATEATVRSLAEPLGARGRGNRHRDRQPRLPRRAARRMRDDASRPARRGGRHQPGPHRHRAQAGRLPRERQGTLRRGLLSRGGGRYRVSVRQDAASRPAVREAARRSCPARALSLLPAAGADLRIRVVGDAAIARWNREFLGRDRPTNVLSFPDGDAAPAPGRRDIGRHPRFGAHLPRPDGRRGRRRRKRGSSTSSSTACSTWRGTNTFRAGRKGGGCAGRSSSLFRRVLLGERKERGSEREPPRRRTPGPSCPGRCSRWRTPRACPGTTFPACRSSAWRRSWTWRSGRASVRDAAWRGWVAGTAASLPLYYWISHTIAVEGKLGWPLGGLAAILLSAYLGA